MNEHKYKEGDDLTRYNNWGSRPDNHHTRWEKMRGNKIKKKPFVSVFFFRFLFSFPLLVISSSSMSDKERVQLETRHERSDSMDSLAL